MDKHCARCDLTKPVSFFWKNAQSRDGFRCYCAECGRKAEKKYKSTNHGKRVDREKSRRRYARLRKQEQARVLKYQTPERRKVMRASRDPYKERARRIAREAVRTGKLVKPKACPECGWTGVIHAHHPDYAKPLEVIWCCSICHGKKHRLP